MPELTVIVLVVGSFAATNVDNLAILVGWLLAGQMPRTEIAAGYAISIATVIFISAVFGLSSRVIPVEWIGWLGIVPITLGLTALVGRFRGGTEDAVPEVSGHAAVFGVAATLIANSVDTVIVFAPLLVDTRDDVDPALIAGFATMGVAWFLIATLMCRHAARLPAITRVAGWIAPLVMIVVGVYIIGNTATDVVLD